MSRKSSIESELCRKVLFFGRIFVNFEEYRTFQDFSKDALLLYELPERNLVDGSPLVAIGLRAGAFPMKSITETVPERARVEPRTQAHAASKSYILRKSSTSAQIQDMIILAYVLKICKKLIKYQNDNATQKLYWLDVF